MIFTGNFTRLTARFASPAQQMQQGQRQLSTEPITQTTAPMRDKTKAIRAKGNPIKKPKGLQSSIINNLLFSLLFFRLFLSSFFRYQQHRTNPFSPARIYLVFGERKGSKARKVNYNHYLPKQILIL